MRCAGATKGADGRRGCQVDWDAGGRGPAELCGWRRDPQPDPTAGGPETFHHLPREGNGWVWLRGSRNKLDATVGRAHKPRLCTWRRRIRCPHDDVSFSLIGIRGADGHLPFAGGAATRKRIQLARGHRHPPIRRGRATGGRGLGGGLCGVWVLGWWGGRGKRTAARGAAGPWCWGRGGGWCCSGEWWRRPAQAWRGIAQPTTRPAARPAQWNCPALPMAAWAARPPDASP